MKGKKFIYNTFVLTATSVLLRTMGLGFQVYISKRMGASGVGLYYLIMSVMSFAATVAISGSRFAATRLVSEELGRGHDASVRHAAETCLLYAVLFGIVSAAVLYFSADFIGVRLIKDARSVFSLKLLAFSMPFISTGAVLGGYFTGVSRIPCSAVGAISEEVFRVGISAVLLSFIDPGDTEMSCASLVIGFDMGELLSFAVILILYLKDVRRYGKVSREPGMLRRVASVAMPLAVSAYGRTALSSIQNLLIPRGLKKSGRSAERSLADYGTINGMVFPIITFPSVLFSSVSELMVPELTREQMKGKTERIRSISRRILSLSLIFSVGVSGVLAAFSDDLGTVFYPGTDVGAYIRALALLTPVMYMDTVTDGMLRGIGEQLFSMKVNIADSLISTALVLFLLPRFAVNGYIFILYSTEIFNFALSIGRLKKKSGTEGILRLAAPCALSSLAAAASSRALFTASGGASSIPGIILAAAVFVMIYVMMLLVTGVLRFEKTGRIIRQNM